MKENTAAIHAQVPIDVATFLLNEKRVDLQLVEGRHRVSVTLIPNMHLETPNYTVTRMRHDDLNQSEPLPPSYNLVEMPAEEEKQPAAGQETATPRQEAAVKGITPQQPAPVVTKVEAPAPAPAPVPVPAAEVSIIAKIVSWFKRKPAETAVAEPVRAAPQMPHRGRGDSGQRDVGRPRDGRRRERAQAGAQKPRPDGAPPQQGENRHEREHLHRRGSEERNEGRRPDSRRQDGGQPQRPRPPREEASAEAPRKAEPPEAPQQQVPREHSEGRGRRRRGRRDRHEHRDEAAGAPQRSAPSTPVTETAGDKPVLPAAAAAVASSIAFTPESVTPQLSAASAVADVIPAAPASTEPMVSTAASVEPETLAPIASATQPAPIADERVREEILAPDFAQSVTRSKAAPAPLQLDWSSDLIQVETHPEKAGIALARTREEPPAPRVKRERPPLPPSDAEPLVQVETRKNEVAVDPVVVVQNAGGGEPLSTTTG